MLKNLYRLDRINRQVQPKISAGRIARVESVDQERALLLARAVNAYLARGRAHDAGDERQRLVNARGGERQTFERLAL